MGIFPRTLSQDGMRVKSPDQVHISPVPMPMPGIGIGTGIGLSVA